MCKDTMTGRRLLATTMEPIQPLRQTKNRPPKADQNTTAPCARIRQARATVAIDMTPMVTPTSRLTNSVQVFTGSKSAVS